MREYLVTSGTAKEDEIDSIERRVIKEIEDAIRYASEECTEPSVDSLYENIYANGEIIR